MIGREHERQLQQQRQARNKMKSFDRGFNIMFVVMAVIGIAWTAFLVWAIASIVMHVTGG